MQVESQESRVECQNRWFALRSHSGSKPSTLDPRLPRGVTLIELLIVIMIISILAAAVLGVAAVAGETAREAKTRTIIARIHSLLMEQYDTYVNRRVKLHSDVLKGIDLVNANAATKGRLKAEARLYALREMMLMEVPDRWSDVLLNSVTSPPASASALAPIYLDVSSATNFRTELANVYLRTYRRIATATNKNSDTTNTVADIRKYQGAECLYMVVMNACGDGESRTLFPESSIGDVDGDGALEFIDGWGHPIEFIRWAPGFESDIQINANELEDATDRDAAWTSAGTTDHDPFDLYRADRTAFRLVPLVYSLGRDEESGIYTDETLVPWRPAPYALDFETNFNLPQPYVKPALSPYVSYSSKYLGTADTSKTDTDNLHNHLIRTR